MTPSEAKTALEQMGVTKDVGVYAAGKFIIDKLPKLSELPTFVRAIKTLGAWSVSTSIEEGVLPRVSVEMGNHIDELVFKVREFR